MIEVPENRQQQPEDGPYLNYLDYFCRKSEKAPFTNMFTHLFFDLDGTLIDSKPGIFRTVYQTLERMGFPAPEKEEELNAFIGPPLRTSFRTLFGMNEQQAEKATAVYRDFYGKDGMHLFTVYPGIYEALEKLRTSGFKLSLVTSKTEYYALQIIEEAKLSGYFETASGSDINGERSEKAELISHTLGKLGLAAGKEVVMIGDRYHDIRGAKLAGISSAAVLYGYGSESELQAEHPDLFVNSTRHLTEVFHNNRKTH